MQVRGTLEAALKPSPKRGSSQRNSALKAALVRAELLLKEVTDTETCPTHPSGARHESSPIANEQTLGLEDPTSRGDTSLAALSVQEPNNGGRRSNNQPKRWQGRLRRAVAQVLLTIGQAHQQLEADFEQRREAEGKAAEKELLLFHCFCVLLHASKSRPPC